MFRRSSHKIHGKNVYFSFDLVFVEPNSWLRAYRPTTSRPHHCSLGCDREEYDSHYFFQINIVANARVLETEFGAHKIILLLRHRMPKRCASSFEMYGILVLGRLRVFVVCVRLPRRFISLYTRVWVCLLTMNVSFVRLCVKKEKNIRPDRDGTLLATWLLCFLLTRTHTYNTHQN